MVNVYLLDYLYMIIIVVLMYMDEEEPNYSLESLNKPLLLLVVALGNRVEVNFV